MAEVNGMPMKVFLVMNLTAIKEDDKYIILYEKYPSGNDKTKWKGEFKVLVHKYKKLRLKVEERLSIYSRVENHKWYMAKDKLCFLYMVLGDTTRLEEQFIYSLREKVKLIIEEDADVFINPTESTRERANFLRDQINEKLERFNKALGEGGNAQDIISNNSFSYDIQEMEENNEVDINEPTLSDAEMSVDVNERDYILKTRRKKLLNIQIVWIVAVILTIGLTFMQMLLFVSDKK